MSYYLGEIWHLVYLVNIYFEEVLGKPRFIAIYFLVLFLSLSIYYNNTLYYRYMQIGAALCFIRIFFFLVLLSHPVCILYMNCFIYNISMVSSLCIFYQTYKTKSLTRQPAINVFLRQLPPPHESLSKSSPSKAQGESQRICKNQSTFSNFMWLQFLVLSLLLLLLLLLLLILLLIFWWIQQSKD